MNNKIIYSTSFIEFLKNSDCKVCKFLYIIHNNIRFEKYLNTDDVNYITFRNNGNISYLPKGKEQQFSDSGEWKREGRQEGKPSKIIRKLFSDKLLKLFKETDFECFANKYKSKFSNNLTFEVLENKEIPNVYCMDRVRSGSIDASCMNGDSSYMDIYKYCKDLKIIVVKNNEGLLCGRSLLWSIDGNLYADRFYVSDDYIYDLFIEYCTNNNILYKQDYKSYNNKTKFVDLSGCVVSKKLTIYTDTVFDSYPYIDTFCYGEDGSINNYMGGSTYAYNNTDGTREGDEDNHDGQMYDDFNDEWIDEDEAIYIQSGERRYTDRCAHIDDCICVNGDWYYKYDSNLIEVNGEHYTSDSDEICYSDLDNEYYLIDDCVYSEDSGSYILTSEAYEIGGNYYHESNVTKC
jgi:hypothetical protein